MQPHLSLWWNAAGADCFGLAALAAEFHGSVESRRTGYGGAGVPKAVTRGSPVCGAARSAGIHADAAEQVSAGSSGAATGDGVGSDAWSRCGALSGSVGAVRG